MSRQEFLNELKNALHGNVSVAQVNDNIRYYDNYIDDEVKKGRAEEVVIQELGNPRLLAKTIISANGDGDFKGFYSDYGENSTSDNAEYKNGSDKGLHAEYSQDKGWDIRFGKFKLNSWYGKILLVLVLILFAVIVGSIFVAVLPIIAAIVTILVVISIIRSFK